MHDEASMEKRDKGSWQKSTYWSWIYLNIKLKDTHQSPLYRIAKIERWGNCKGRNVTEMSLEKLPRLCRGRVHRIVSRGDALLYMIAIYMKFYGFFGSNYSTSVRSDDFSSFKNSIKFKIKMSQLIVQIYKLSLTLTLYSGTFSFTSFTSKSEQSTSNH